MNSRFLNRNVTFVVLLGLAWVPRVSAELLPSKQLDSAPTSGVVSGAVQAGERLSDWVLRNVPAMPNSHALHWLVAAERGPQLALRNAVLSGLRIATSGGTGGTGAWRVLESLPVTGRVLLASSDGYWLQVSPQFDPVLGDRDYVRWYREPSSVGVMGHDGQVCLVTHQPLSQLRQYVRACIAAESPIDTVWVVQPDGRVIKVAFAEWNAEQDIELAPGAWIWAPGRGAVGEGTSANLARFLATQPPAENIWPEKLRFEPAALLEKRVITKPQLTASDWGEIGLLQTPTARMAPAGSVRTHFSGSYPYTRGTVMLQPFDGMEAGFRYTDIANRLYGESIAGDQTYKDKSIDVKLRLLKESANLPELAVGMRDIGGTGLFSGEYLVANKRWGAWDASLGLGWGYLGGRGDIQSPLGFLGSSFNKRSTFGGGSGGETNEQNLFRGDASVFGGVQWSSPTGKWVFKAEYDGNNYASEPLGGAEKQDSPFNFGMVYRYSPNVDLSAGYERGNRVMLGLTLYFGLHQLEMPKFLDRPLPALAAKPLSPAEPLNWSAIATEINAQTGWTVRTLSIQGHRLVLSAESDGAIFLKERVEKAIRVLHHRAPAAVRHFSFELSERGLAMMGLDIDRAEWLTQQTQAQAPALTLPALQARASTVRMAPVSASDGSDWFLSDKSASSFAVVPSYSQSFGGPDGFVLYRAGVSAKFEQRLTPTTWLSATLNGRAFDNYDTFVYNAPSNLPRVRTDVRRYVTSSRVTLPELQVTHVEDFGGGHYASVYGGFLESMYAGVGGEWLYRPWQSNFAFGVDVNRVRQRGFSQDFALRDYQVNTGHATAYWDTGWNGLRAKLQVGQYLAGDVGATLDLHRVFANGTTIGAWATKTNVSAEQFGEGSFDKGIYVTIPIDLLLPRTSAGTANVVWSPLTRDGGARLARSVGLFDLTSQRDARAMQWVSDPTTRQKNHFRFGEDLSLIESDPVNSWGQVGGAAKQFGQRVSGVPASAWATGVAGVMLSGFADTELKNWAANHQGGGWERAAKLSNALPVALALGTGALATGLAGDSAADTARSSLMAAGVTLGANTVLKYAVGRSRPKDGLGASDFQGGTVNAGQSSFASNHVATTFALITPFAQRYDQPGLYALAATSALGRIQQGEHWFSDTVAGAFLGYAIGSLMPSLSAQKPKGWQADVSPQYIGATKRF